MTGATISTSGSGIEIATGGFAPYWFTPDGFPPAVKTPRVTEVSAPFVDSMMPTHMTLDSAVLAYTVFVSGASASQLDNRIEALNDALLQFSYTVTTDRDGIVKVYACWSGLMAPVDLGRDDQMQAAFLAKYSLTIPCHPTPA